MMHASAINHPTGTIRRLGIDLLGVLFALALITLGFALYTANADAIAANAAEVRVQGLVNQLDDAQLTPSRHLAQQQLEAVGPAAVDPLIASLHAPSATLRRNSAEMLGFIASPRALDALTGVLETDLVATVRSRAAWALGELNDVRAVTALERALVLDSNLSVRQEALGSLNALRAHLTWAADKNEPLASAVAVAPSQTNRVYLAKSNQLSISRDGGKSWSTLAATIPSRIVTLAVSPTNPDEIYAGTESLGLYNSTDGGATWFTMNQGLGLEAAIRLNITALAIDPKNPERLYAAREVWSTSTHASLLTMGIMQSLDQGRTWKSVGLETKQAITRLVIVNHTLYALSGDEIVLPPLQWGVAVSTLLHDNSEVLADGPTCASSNCR